VPFEAYSWLLTDPETEVGCAPLADVPCLPELPRLIRLKYLTAINRWTHLRSPAASLRTTTKDDREQSLVWRELLHAYDVNDVASLVFRDRFGCWAFLELWRIGSGPGFTRADVEFMSGLTGVVTDALRRVQAETLGSTSARPDPTGPVVLVMSADLEVRAQTPETEQYLRILVPPDEGHAPVPAGAYNVAAQLIAIESGIDDHPAFARVHLTGRDWLTLRAARIGTGEPSNKRDIAVTIESTSPSERLPLFARACGLSARETDLLRHLATGDGTREIAQRMYVSEHTVQDHLKSIFTKTGTRSRQILLARATGT
jgi:DNA-binding CsgD family transcriptional regulator